MKISRTNVKTTLESVQNRVYVFSSELIYSIATSIRINELVNESTNNIAFSSLKTKTPELYKIVLYSVVVSIDKRDYIN